MSDRRILHLVNRLDQASATYRATRDLCWQAAVSEAAREKQAAERTLLQAWRERQAHLNRGGVA